MERLGEISGKTKLAEHIRYVLGHWDGLCVFLDDGRVEMDTNTIERGMRPQKLTAKNALFAGSDAGAQRWAIVASLIETCLCRMRHRAVYAAASAKCRAGWAASLAMTEPAVLYTADAKLPVYSELVRMV
jgi:hypothetical protein